jgi:hypothetical protein
MAGLVAIGLLIAAVARTSTGANVIGRVVFFPPAPATNLTDPTASPASPRPPPASPRAPLPAPAPVSYATDTKRDLSTTPATPIGDVDGVGDRSSNLSMG